MYMNSVENVLKIMTGNGTAGLYMFFSDSPLCKGVLVFFNIKCNVDILNIHKSNDGKTLLVNHSMLK